MDAWIRYFGPPVCIVSDQEGALLSEFVGRCCERFSIARDFGGSQGHTGAPLAERRIEIVRATAQKLWADVQQSGLQYTREDCVLEAAMAANLMLSYGGFSPTCAVFGFHPRELYDFENPGVQSVASAVSTTPDAMEQALRLRLLAKDCVLKSVVEDRLARAANTKTHQHKPEDVAKMSADGCQVDLWREPDSKDDPGWRGPASMVKLHPDKRKAVVDWRGHVMTVPIRHLRPHVGLRPNLLGNESAH